MFNTTRTDDTANTDPGTTHAVQAVPESTDPTVTTARTETEGRSAEATTPARKVARLVEDWLRDHASDEFSPSAIGKALHRSSGAVANALDKLVADGYATQTCDKPKRFTAAKTIPEPATLH
jgi:hypothetical protein